jgi:hypothetical protein
MQSGAARTHLHQGLDSRHWRGEPELLVGRSDDPDVVGVTHDCCVWA